MTSRPCKTTFSDDTHPDDLHRNQKGRPQMMRFKTVQVDGVELFYREAGEPGNPKLVLLGGFPSSSHQWRELLPALAAITRRSTIPSA
jgi:hypothetical protein